MLPWSICQSPAPFFPPLWTPSRDTSIPLLGAIHPFLTANINPSCFTLSENFILYPIPLILAYFKIWYFLRVSCAFGQGIREKLFSPHTWKHHNQTPWNICNLPYWVRLDVQLFLLPWDKINGAIKVQPFLMKYHKSWKLAFCPLFKMRCFCLDVPFYTTFPHFQQRRTIFAWLCIQRGSSLFPLMHTDALTALMEGNNTICHHSPQKLQLQYK